MRRRVLIVVSSYRPAMLADMQRARALAWELPPLGWDVEVLAPAASEVRRDAIEPDADGFFAPETPVHEVRTWLPLLFRLLTVGAGTWRMWLPMYWRGRTLIASGRFDLVYFSTTAFNFFFFGPLWRSKFGVPYVLDFQDPWVLPDRETSAPGWKACLAALLDPALEKRAVRDAAGLIAVSQNYIDSLVRRYGKQPPDWLRQGRHAVIPFCAMERDFDGTGKKPDCTVPQSPELLLHYVGAGPLMQRSFSVVCQALSRLRARGDVLAAQVRIRLFGTGSIGHTGVSTSLKEVASHAGVGDLVEEQPERVPFRRALELLGASRGLLILGVDDRGYMPSKLFGYALSEKPLLACLRRAGPAYALFEGNSELGRALWFDAAGAMPLDDAAAIFRRFLEDVAASRRFDRRAVIAPYLAPAMAQRHVDIFDACLANTPQYAP